MSGYPNLSQITDPALASAIKIACDRLAAQERIRRGASPIVTPSAAIAAGAQRFAGVQAPVAETDGVTKSFLFGAVQQTITDALSLTTGQGTLKPGPGPVTPPQPNPDNPPSGPANTDITLGQPGGIPGAPNLRWFRGNMGGIRVPGLPAVPGGATGTDAFGESLTDLVLTWFIDRYSGSDQSRIFSQYTADNYTHFLLSWPDSRSVGASPSSFASTVQLVQSNGLIPVIFLLSKDYDPRDMDASGAGPIIDPAIQACLGVGGTMIFCVGWELNLFNDPNGPFQSIIDHIAQQVVPAFNLYVHFSEDVMAWQPPGTNTATFWNRNIGQLTGLLHQKRLGQDDGLYQARLADVQNRFAGGAGFSSDSGFGHPWDVVACECTVAFQFGGSVSESQGDHVGFIAICSPGGVPVSGFNNGCALPGGGRV